MLRNSIPPPRPYYIFLEFLFLWGGPRGGEEGRDRTRVGDGFDAG